MDRVIVGDKAQIKESIVGRHVTVASSSRKPTKIDSISVIADDVILEQGCTLTGTKIYPHQFVRGEFENQALMPG